MFGRRRRLGFVFPVAAFDTFDEWAGRIDALATGRGWPSKHFVLDDIGSAL